MSNKKKLSIIGGSLVLVAAVVACVVLLAANNKSNNNNATAPPDQPVPETSTSVKAIRSICQPTTYRETCEEALTKAVGNQTDIKSLIKTSFLVSIDHIREAANHSAILTAASRDPETVLPLQTCSEVFKYAVQDLEDAVDHILGYQLTDLDKAVYDLKNWLSAANTYQETCLDEFNNKTCEAAESMRKALTRSMELTANALAIIHQVGNMISEFMLPSLGGGSSGNRRLLGVDDDGFPPWLSQGRRRLLQLAPFQMKPLVTVAKDGSGQFKTITEGIAAMPRNNKDYVVMYVKEGVYQEVVIVERTLNKLIIIGDGPTKTRITGNLNVAHGGGIGTFQTTTFGVIGSDFMARDIGFENTAGSDGHQAVAFRSQSDQSVLYNCHFDGYQDTLYAMTKRHYYRDCTISGTVDFIFGDATAIFQNCNIIVRRPMANQQNIVTAHGSKFDKENTMYVLQNCSITAEPALVPFITQNPTYLGRPWKPYARTIYMQSYIDTLIHPNGWMPWAGEPDSINTCFYSEIDNHGPGADKTTRVKWPGVKNLDLDTATMYTLDNLYQGAEWVKQSGAPFFGGLRPSDQPQPRGRRGRGRGRGRNHQG